MLKSFISLRPLSPASGIKISFQTPPKLVDLVVEGVQVLFTILSFLSLEDIYKLYKIYKRVRHGKQVENKVILYLTVSYRRFRKSEQKDFVRQLTRGNTRFSLRQYNSQNNIWKESINLDIQRTYLNQLTSMRSSSNNLFTKESAFQQSQKQLKQSNSDIFPIPRSKRNFPTLKFNFLIFNYDDFGGRNKSNERRISQDLSLKEYLKVVLNAISNRNKKLGYVQGLNFWIKHMFQSGLSEEQAFGYACFLLQSKNAQMLFKDQLAKVRQMCYVFDIYLFNNLPNLYYLLKLYDVCTTIYASNWFITLFSEQLQKTTINKIWHLFSIKGWKVLIKFGIAVMCVFQQKIKKVPQDQIFCFMRNILQNVNKQSEMKIWAVMSSTKVSNKMISYLCKQMKILYNDTEIQLWRIEQQRRYNERLYRIQCRSFSFSCQPNISQINENITQRKKVSFFNHYQERTSKGCCVYSNQKIKTEETEDNYNILSLCRSVQYN